MATKAQFTGLRRATKKAKKQVDPDVSYAEDIPELSRFTRAQLLHALIYSEDYIDISDDEGEKFDIVGARIYTSIRAFKQRRRRERTRRTSRTHC
jgi:hypothetical protein